ncbi:hypothetical protein FRC08_003198 [Ceratobasidium sp. 394]|nr:hypothetical protein FRC08_003198 [Ceratobasidium sp. 394]KAG9079118.1 hypothetical protein FS749_008812 [Ceratobasidium sp. UAMH 11750]
MEEDKLLDLLTSVKNMVKSDPAVARTTLTSHPNLAYALMKEMVTLDLVDPDVLTRTLQAATGVQPTPTPAPLVQAYPPPPPPQASYPPAAPPSYPPAPPAPAPSIPPHMYQQSRQQQQQQNAPTPPPPQPAYQSRGPPPPQVQTQAPAPMGLAPEQQAMIQRLAMLTPDQIAALPPADRAALLELRRQLGLS